MYYIRRQGWVVLGNKDEEEEEEDKVHDLVEGGGLAEGVGDELGMLHELLVKGVGVIMQDPTCGTINSDVLETKILHGARAEVEQQEVEVEVQQQRLDQQRLNPTMKKLKRLDQQKEKNLITKQRPDKKKLLKTRSGRMEKRKKKVTMKMSWRN